MNREDEYFLEGQVFAYKEALMMIDKLIDGLNLPMESLCFAALRSHFINHKSIAEDALKRIESFQMVSAA